MSKELTDNQIKKLAIKLSADARNLVEKFEKKTGCKVTDFKFEAYEIKIKSDEISDTIESFYFIPQIIKPD